MDVSRIEIASITRPLLWAVIGAAFCVYDWEVPVNRYVSVDLFHGAIGCFIVFRVAQAFATTAPDDRSRRVLSRTAALAALAGFAAIVRSIGGLRSDPLYFVPGAMKLLGVIAMWFFADTIVRLATSWTAPQSVKAWKRTRDLVLWIYVCPTVAFTAWEIYRATPAAPGRLPFDRTATVVMGVIAVLPLASAWYAVRLMHIELQVVVATARRLRLERLKPKPEQAKADTPKPEAS